jgi:hypothetical protein
MRDRDAYGDTSTAPQTPVCSLKAKEVDWNWSGTVALANEVLVLICDVANLI